MKNFIRNSVPIRLTFVESVPNRQKVSRFGTESIKDCESVAIRQNLDNSYRIDYIQKIFSEFQLLNWFWAQTRKILPVFPKIFQMW